MCYGSVPVNHGSKVSARMRCPKCVKESGRDIQEQQQSVSWV